MKEERYREMEVKGITLDPYTSTPIVLLKEAGGKETMPIWIGLLEASAIAAELEKMTLSRPLTHDLLGNIIDLLGGKVMRIEVNDLRDNTFYATIHLKRGRKEVAVDSRPSDAIAVALRMGSPIFVNETVIERSRKIDLTGGGKGENILEKLSPEVFGKYKM